MASSQSEEFDQCVIRTKVTFGKFFPDEDWKMLEEKFREDDQDFSGYLSLEDLKRAQQKMENPITHASLKSMLNEVAEDPKKGLSFPDFIKMQLVINGHDISTINERTKLALMASKAVDGKVGVEMKKLDLSRAKGEERVKLERRESRDQFKQDFAVFGQLVTPRAMHFRKTEAKN
jgi:EF-hand domain pair